MAGLTFLYKVVLLARTAKSSTSFDPSMLYLVLSLVLLFVLLLILIFFKDRIIPVIRVTYLRIVHGQYSFEYLEFFKKYDLRNPLNNCIKDEITLHVSVFFKRLKGSSNYTTTIPIEFKDVPFLTSYNSLVKEFGKPDCINIARFDRARVKVIGYNETFHQKRMKSLFYFLEDEFFMGEFIFSETHRMDPTQIREGISQKYLEGGEVNQDAFYIEGPLGNILNYHDNGFFASVKYLFRGEQRINEILTDVFVQSANNGQAFKKAMMQEESLNRF